MAGMKIITGFFSLIGNLSCFGLRALAAVFVPPYEWQYFVLQIEAIGWQSLPLISAAGLALGVVMTLHTRSSLVSFGAGAWAPNLQSQSFFNELGPLVSGLLVAGRAGAGIGAELANMRVTEQIDALEVLSFDSFRLLLLLCYKVDTPLKELRYLCAGMIVPCLHERQVGNLRRPAATADELP
jgi:phospholipid/cholesterol/gamma-HCH transport system permease protein